MCNSWDTYRFYGYNILPIAVNFPPLLEKPLYPLIIIHTKSLLVITHLEPDILEWKVKWALGIITMKKPTGGDSIPAELFYILKHDAVEVLHSICQKIWKTKQWPQTGKGQFSSQSQRKALPKKVQTTAQWHSSHTLAK